MNSERLDDKQMPPQPPHNPRSEIHRINQVTDGSCLPIMDFVMPILAEEPYPGHDGIGVVIVAGGKYLRYAFGAVAALRKLDPRIPVQIWHMPGEDISGAPKFEQFGNVTFHDIGPVFQDECSWVRTGYSAKIHAVKACSFRHVHLLDADCIPLRPPSEFFESVEYGTTGMLFWPDVMDHNKAAIWPSMGLKYKSVPEHETGQQFIDKQRAWETVKLGAWMGSHHFFHDVCLGDKNLFGLAAAKLRKPFYTMPSAEWRDWGIMQHDFQGRPAFMHTMADKRGGAKPPKKILDLWNSYHETPEMITA